MLEELSGRIDKLARTRSRSAHSETQRARPCSRRASSRTFAASGVDVLVLEDCVLHKEDQPESARPKTEEYLAQFKLD
jgi:hypothetical protein